MARKPKPSSGSKKTAPTKNGLKDLAETHQLRQKLAKAKPQPEKMSLENKSNDDAYLESTSPRIKTVAEALKKAEVDENLWAVERFLVNSWEIGAKGPDNLICVEPLWQVKVWLKKAKGWSPVEFRRLLLDDIKKLSPQVATTHHKSPRLPKTRAHEPLLAELSIFDAHFGKLAWKPESGQDYDLKICEKRYMTAARDLLKRAEAFSPERILYVVGNDFFHTDQGRAGATTAGTVQDCDGRWQKAFRVGTQCAITIAEEAASFAETDILVVPGNHDSEKSFCLGEVLAGRFHGYKDIKIINNPSVFSYYRYGKNLLGFVHGDEMMSDKKRGQLPATMATDMPKDWSETICREWHLGHQHAENESVWKYRSAESIRDVVVRVCPSLSSSDCWHRWKNYKSVLAAELHLFHKDRGRYAYLVHQAVE